MVDLLHKTDGFTEPELVLLLNLVQKYPYFELAQEKLLQATSQLGIHGIVDEKLRERKVKFGIITNTQKERIEVTEPYFKQEELLDKFLSKYQLPSSPLYFLDK